MILDVKNLTHGFGDRGIFDDNLKGMGTTIVAALVKNKEACIAHVGDSRAYIIHSDCIEQITKDHSIVQQLIDSGTITEEQAKYHPQRNLITRAVGTEKYVLADGVSVDVSSGDYILICSDGLSSYVDESEITDILANTKLNEVVSKLIEAANNSGGKDNVTVVVIKA